MEERTITLTRDLYERFLLMAGMATMIAFTRGDDALAYSFLQLVNHINKDNPDWVAYEIPDYAKLSPQ